MQGQREDCGVEVGGWRKEGEGRGEEKTEKGGGCDVS